MARILGNSAMSIPNEIPKKRECSPYPYGNLERSVMPNITGAQENVDISGYVTTRFGIVRVYCFLCPARPKKETRQGAILTLINNGTEYNWWYQTFYEPRTLTALANKMALEIYQNAGN